MDGSFRIDPDAMWAEAIRIHQRCQGDVDGWARTGDVFEKQAMTDQDWSGIDEPLQRLALVKNVPVAESFRAATAQLLAEPGSRRTIESPCDMSFRPGPSRYGNATSREQLAFRVSPNEPPSIIHRHAMSTAYNLPQISYWVAYRVLPYYAFQSVEKAIEAWTKTTTSAGPFYYLMACQMAKLEPVHEDARLYSAALGTLGDYDYYLLEYPVPPPVDMSGTDPVTLAQQGAGIVLAPHFSVIVRHRVSHDVRYFVLGQAPLGGGTTFRSVTAAGANANLGSGPAPQRDLFLGRVSQALTA